MQTHCDISILVNKFNYAVNSSIHWKLTVISCLIKQIKICEVLILQV